MITDGEPMSGKVTVAAIVLLGALMHLRHWAGKVTWLAPRSGKIHRRPKLHSMVTILLIQLSLEPCIDYKSVYGPDENLIGGTAAVNLVLGVRKYEAGGIVFGDFLDDQPNRLRPRLFARVGLFGLHMDDHCFT
jgi:hypothetical protein